jgi:hypothetical protein
MNKIRMTVLCVCTAVFGACGGGGDDDSGAVTPANQSAVGVWSGNLVYDGGAGTRPITVIVSGDGKFASAISSAPGTTNGRTLTGTGTINGNQFSATGLSVGTAPFPAGGTSATASLMGTVVSRASINGSYSAGGESGTFVLTYQALTDRASSLATVGGTYTGIAAIGSSGVMNSNNGVLVFNSTNCVGNGTIATIDTTLNTYTWTIQMSAIGASVCSVVGTYTGLGYLSDVSAGSTNNVLVMFGTQPSAGATPAKAYFFVGQK